MGKALDLLRGSYEIFDRHDWEEIQATFDEIFHTDAEFRNPIGTFADREILALWEGFLVAFPDVHHEVVSSIEQGDSVCVEGKYKGTHTGPLRMPGAPEIPPTGRSLSIDYCHIGRLEGDRFSSWHVYFDPAAIMQQLGVAPEPAQV